MKKIIKSNSFFRAQNLALASLVLFSTFSTFLIDTITSRRYVLSSIEQNLVSKSTVKKELIKETQDAILYNRSEESNPQSAIKQITIAANKEDSSGNQTYQAKLPKDFSKGISFSDSSGNRELRITPSFTISEPKNIDDRVVYPGPGNEKHIYTFKNNGLKSDIVLVEKPTSNDKKYSYTLGLGKDLEAKLLPSGNVGIYSADPNLYGNIQIGDQKSQDLIDQARKNGTKNTLVYELPRPFIIDSNKNTNYEDVYYGLDTRLDQEGNPVTTLTINAKNLDKQSYPLSIDPTVTVTTTADFQTDVGGVGDIDYSTSGQISRNPTVYGGTQTFNATSSLFSGRSGTSTNAYNDRLYTTGGLAGVVSPNYTTSTVQYTTINANGTLATWGTTTAFSGERYYHDSFIYNGYIYVLGGSSSPTSPTLYNDVQYAKIDQATGMVGAWQYANSFNNARWGHKVATWNGYVYLTGGYDGTNYYNDVQFATINADGTLGQWNYTYNGLSTSSFLGGFTTTRHRHAALAYRGFIYVIGGNNTSYVSNVSFARINNDGTIGAWASTTSLPTTRASFSYAVSNGYIYIVGGYNGGIMNHASYASIRATGELGSWSTGSSNMSYYSMGQSAAIYNGFLYVVGANNAGDFNRASVEYTKVSEPAASTFSSATSLTTARANHGAVAYNGYLYIVGGGSGPTNEVRYASILSSGSLGSWSSATALAEGLADPGVTVHNGYIYVVGGYTGSVARANVYYSQISSTGTLGSWNSTSGLNTARWRHGVTVHKGYIYAVGGRTSVAINGIEYAAINSDGTLGTWQSSAISLPVALEGAISTAYKDKLYVTGGVDGSSTYYASVRYITIGSSGALSGSWTTGSSFTNARAFHGGFINNGYIFVAGGWNGTTNYSSMYYAPINSDGSIGTWVSTTNMTLARRGFVALAYNGYMYSVGGYNETTLYQPEIYYAAIGPPSSTASTSWTTESYLFGARTNASAAAYGDFIYTAGGSHTASDTTCSTVSETKCNDIQFAQVGEDGTLSGWQKTTNLPAYIADTQLFAYNGYLYMVGGSSSVNTYEARTWYALICTGSNIGVGGCNSIPGSVGTWTQSAHLLTTSRSGHEALVYNGYAYAIGGWNGSNINSIEYAPIGSSGDLSADWATAANTFTTARHHHSAYAYNGYLYISGGWNGTTTYSDVQLAPINADGTLGTWSATTSLISARRVHSMIINNGDIYVLGGIGGLYLYDYEHATLSPNGQVGSWTSTNTSSTALVHRRSHGAVYSNGHMYVIAGDQNATSTDCKNDGTTEMVCSSVLSLELNSISSTARYERTVDTGSGANTISSFAISGTSACRYQVSYATANGAGVYGTSTRLYDAVPGTTYTVNSSEKRYIRFAIDMNEDACGAVSTITDITVTYTNPSASTPTLLLPANGATNVSTLPEFRLGSTDGSYEYIRYKIEVCSTSNCSSIVRTIDQTSTQTGWMSQSTQSGTAYTTSSGAITQYAIHNYQTSALSNNTTYYWRAYAIDPAGSNTWSSASSINSFTTLPAATTTNQQVIIKGGTDIGGSVILKP